VGPTGNEEFDSPHPYKAQTTSNIIEVINARIGPPPFLTDGPAQNTNRAESCMILGPALITGVPNAVNPRSCGTRHGAPAMPQAAGLVE
jgi:hypothetical protein